MDAPTLAAMGEPTRFAIVELLRDDALPSVSEIATTLGIRQPQASKHLQVLREAGVVSAERDARRVVHRLRPEVFADLVGWVESFSALWETRLDALGAYLESSSAGPPADDTDPHNPRPDRAPGRNTDAQAAVRQAGRALVRAHLRRARRGRVAGPGPARRRPPVVGAGEDRGDRLRDRRARRRPDLDRHAGDRGHGQVRGDAVAHGGHVHRGRLPRTGSSTTHDRGSRASGTPRPSSTSTSSCSRAPMAGQSLDLTITVSDIGSGAKMAAVGMKWGYKQYLDKLEAHLAS